MGGTQNFVHGIYREKIPRYRVYRGTCFVVVITNQLSKIFETIIRDAVVQHLESHKLIV